MTVGLHAGVAAAEWHLHAWDLATAAGKSHRPSDPHTLFLATAACMLAAQGGLRARLGSKLVPGLAKSATVESAASTIGSAPISTRLTAAIARRDEPVLHFLGDQHVGLTETAACRGSTTRADSCASIGPPLQGDGQCRNAA